MTGVLRPGHAQLRVLDLEEAVHFYTEVIGLKETGRDAQGRVYFKAWDERDHNSLILREADSAGMDFFAFKVADKATLDKLDADLQAFGLKTERIPAGEMLETGERVEYQTDVQASSDGAQSSESRKTVILSEGSSYDKAAVAATTYPRFQGALIVCEGADSAAVRLRLLEAVSAVTGLSTDRITVVKMRS
jgi:catechol 2,3-dioxygenase-like lactoylglutathione lyase family enzyme